MLFGSVAKKNSNALEMRIEQCCLKIGTLLLDISLNGLLKLKRIKSRSTKQWQNRV